ncbi:hypothetical protein CRE_24408 [Caenorhabditis remanei]|uniref:G-protein coupled receptors family 1 profile domain-containing protein n=1 Tax=Caenorhabditis remanei TaxID=31234 RepID=E3MFU4_CAERE|nr:hypothetical protein CRE_24408 [Caenorhabditis remanei]
MAADNNEVTWMSCESFFPNYNGWTLKLICFLYDDFYDFVNDHLQKNGVHVAAVCILINIFHIIVLTQKSMRTSSIYVLLAAVAFMDICSLSYDVHVEIVNFFKVMTVCYSKETDYRILVINNIMDTIRNFARRCSTWLSLSIAVIRTIVIKYPMNPKVEILSQPKAGFFTIIGVLFLCFPIQILDSYRYEIEFTDPHYKCSQDLLKAEFLFYQNIKSLSFPSNNKKLYTFYKITDALLSKIIPCIAFPVVTLFLILKIRKANIQRQKLESSSETKKSKNTSKLVLCLTLPFFIAELPLGIVFWMSQSDIFVEEERFYFILEAFEKCFSFILSATTATHMIICVFMSSQYRESLISVLQCGFASQSFANVHVPKHLCTTLQNSAVLFKEGTAPLLWPPCPVKQNRKQKPLDFSRQFLSFFTHIQFIDLKSRQRLASKMRDYKEWRKKANARQKEANRVIRDAFHQLRMVLPWKNNDGVPTRRMILWRAIE